MKTHHELADLFPLLEGAAFDALVADIKANGLNEPIVLLDGQILDGRNRYRACKAAGVKPVFTKFEGKDPATWVLSTNATRRHLGNFAKRMAAARIVDKGVLGLSQAASIFAISPGQILGAKRLLDKNPELFAKIEKDGGKGYIQATSTARAKPGTMRTRATSVKTDENGQLLSTWTKNEVVPADAPLPSIPEGFLIKKSSSMVTNGETRVQWISSEPEKVKQWEAMIAAIERATSKYKGVSAPAPVPGNTNDRLFTWYPLGDPHIGLLSYYKEIGQNFDADIMVDDMKRVVSMLADRAPASKFAMLSNLGDFFHSENDQNRTPGSGHALDVDGRAGKIMEMGYTLMRILIDTLLKKHEFVEVHSARGNHDPITALAMSMYLKGAYERDPRVTVHDSQNPFFVREWGNNLWLIHHGDGCKPEKLPGILATYENGAPWGRTIHRRAFTGHIHSDNSKEFPGMMWESFGNLASNDYWAHHAGYRGAGKSLDTLTFDIDHGLVSRSIVNLRMARMETA